MVKTDKTDLEKLKRIFDIIKINYKNLQKFGKVRLSDNYCIVKHSVENFNSYMVLLKDEDFSFEGEVIDFIGDEVDFINVCSKYCDSLKSEVRECW